MTKEHGAEEEKTKVFVSYSRKDRDSVKRLASALEADGSIDVLLDTEDILPTEEWRSRLEGLIAQADTIVFCLTPRSAVSEVCAWEVATAERFNKRIAPIVIEDVEGQVPGGLAKLNYIFFTGRDDFEAALAKLREALDADIGWIREHTRIGELARRWDVEGRRPADLMRGPSLEAAEAWLVGQPATAPPPTMLHRDYIGGSRRAATRRQRAWLAGSTIAAVVALTLAALAYWQRGVAVAQRTEATARRLSAEAQVTLADPLADPQTAVRDLLMSLSLAPSDAASKAISVGTSRLQPRTLGTLPWPADATPPRLIEFSPDGAWLGVVTTNEALFWDVQTRRLALRRPVADLEGRPSLAFAEGAALALVAVSAKAGAASAAWTAIDLATGRTAAASEDAFDVAVLGSDILVLRRSRDGAQAEIANLMTGSLVQRVASPALSGPPVFGRLFKAAAAPPAVPAMVARSVCPAPRPGMVLLVDAKGVAGVAEIGATGPTTRLELPGNSTPLAVDAEAGLLAVRQSNAGDAVVRLPAGDRIWQARDGEARFLGFAGGGRFLAVGDDRGVRIESIEGGLSARAESERRTDYDLAAQSDLAQYTPIISVEIAKQAGLLVSARKDGRVAVWRPGARPRYGASFGALPMPNFELVASLDHGETLGDAGGWSSTPVLFVSPDGRYVASQSGGIERNPVGGIIKSRPLVRIWDSQYRREIARFRPRAPMLIAFAPSRGEMATMSAEPSAANPKEVSLALALWDVSERAPPLEEHAEISVERPAPPAHAASELKPAAGLNAAMLTQQRLQPVWVGADLRLRALDPETGAVVVVEDLTPILRGLAGRMGAMIGGQTSREDPVAQLARTTVGLPADAPVPFPIAVSADGLRAAVALGPTVRLYALDGPARLLRSFELDAAGDPGAAWPLGLALSPTGEALAVGVMMLPPRDAPPQPLAGAPEDAKIFVWPARLLVYSADAERPIYNLPQQLVLIPPIRMHPLEQVIALGPEGRLLLVDETTFHFDTLPPEVKAQLKVRDLRTGQVILALPSRDLFVKQLASMEADHADPPSGVFNTTGDKLVAIRDAPDCPMKEVNTLSMLPVSAPSCPDRRMNLSLWSLTAGTQVAATSIVRRQAEIDEDPTDLARAMLQAMPRGVNSARITLDDADPPEVSIDELATRVLNRCDGPVFEMTHTRRRVSFADNRIAVEDACARLPRTLSELDEATWAAVVPDESFRAVCPSNAAPAGSR